MNKIKKLISCFIIAWILVIHQSARSELPLGGGSSPGQITVSAPLPRPKPSQAVEVKENAQKQNLQFVQKDFKKIFISKLKEAEKAGIVSLKEKQNIENKKKRQKSKIPQERAQRVKNKKPSKLSKPNSNNTCYTCPGNSLSKASQSKNIKEKDNRKLSEAQEKNTIDQKLNKIKQNDMSNQECISTQELTFSEQADGQDLDQMLGKTRTRLIEEMDQTNQTAILDLAKLYIAHGLVPEARAAFSMLERSDAMHLPLYSMIAVVDDEPLPESTPLLTQGCPGVHSVWTAVGLLSHDRPEDALSRASTISLYVQNLPPFLAYEFSVRLGLAATRVNNLPALKKFAALASRFAPLGYTSTRQRSLEAEIIRLEGHQERFQEKLLWLWSHYPKDEAATHAILELGNAIAEGVIDVEGSTYRLRLDLATLGRLAPSENNRQVALALEARLAARELGMASGTQLLSLARRNKKISDSMFKQTMLHISNTYSKNKNSKILPLSYLYNYDEYKMALNEPTFRKALAISFSKIGLPSFGEQILKLSDWADEEIIIALAESYARSGELRAVERLMPYLEDTAMGVRLSARLMRVDDNPQGALELLSDLDNKDPAELARLAWSAADWKAAAGALSQIAESVDNTSVVVRQKVASERSLGIGHSYDGSSVRSDALIALPTPSVDSVNRFLRPLREESENLWKALENG